MFASAAYAAEGGSAGMPQFDATSFPSQIVWLIISVVVLHILLSRLILPRMTDIQANRKQASSGELDRAAELHARAEKLEAAAAAHQAETEAAARQLAAEAHAEIDREIKDRQAEADARLEAAAAEGEARIRKIRDAAIEDVGTVARAAAEELAGRFLPEPPDRNTTDSAVDGLLRVH